MTIEEARALIRGVEWRGSRPGLSRVRELLHRIGDPQDTLQFVHIAGTNGKGSTAAMLAAVLQAAGYTTGLFTSPFLEQFAERMQVNGQPIPDAELAAACETLQPCIAAMDDQPTEFELVTAAAMLWFQRRGCDIVVLEVGLGGRLDATNVIGAPACAVITNIDEQSADIALGVDHSLESKQTGEDALDNGAGDQGMMFGYACDETPELMPLPISLAHKLAKRLTAVRKQELVDYLRPDGKTQVTIEYDEQNHPVRVHTVVLSTQHAPEVDMAKLRADMIELVIRPTIPAELLDSDTRYLINPTGRFVVGGPQADSGLTGRKIIVDTYGGSAPHGGGAFSGKDPTKVDRSAAYAARYVAKNIVAAGLAKRCLVQLAYAIGVAEPVSVFVDTQGTGTVPDAQIAAAVQQVFDLRPTAIIRDLELSRPIYRQLAAYGHMGREELGVRWEDTDRVDALRAAVAKA